MSALLVELAVERRQPLIQQGGHPESQALLVGVGVQLLLQRVVEAQDVAVTGVLLLVSLLHPLPQQGELALHALQPLQVGSGERRRDDDWLRASAGGDRGQRSANEQAPATWSRRGKCLCFSHRRLRHWCSWRLHKWCLGCSDRSRFGGRGRGRRHVSQEGEGGGGTPLGEVDGWKVS